MGLGPRRPQYDLGCVSDACHRKAALLASAVGGQSRSPVAKGNLLEVHFTHTL